MLGMLHVVDLIVGMLVLYLYVVCLIMFVHVSSNTINYSLNKNITIENIVKDLNKLFSQFTQEELRDSLLKITIQKINCYAGDSPLPKIEYKDKDSLT
jgi:hypothetical protein